MDTDEFWNLIDATRPAEPDPDVHAAAIAQALVDRGPADTLAFAREFDRAVDALYRWDVWGAAYLLLGGLSDDGFEYFRCWVVGEGRRTWEQVQADPEAYAVTLVEQVVAEEGELYESLAERGVDDAEVLLYAAGTAHEQLTGQWTPADPARQALDDVGPAGEEWDEDDVGAAFPRLAAALAAAEEAGAVNSDRVRATYSETFEVEGGGRLVLEEFTAGAGPVGGEPAMADLATSAADLQAIVDAVREVDERWRRGDHNGVVVALTPVLDHPNRRALLSSFLPPDLAGDLLYQGGISRLQGGDPDGAADWLEIAVDAGVADDRLRRALAQVELSRGELDRAEALLDAGPGAAPMALALATAVAGYRRDHAEVLRRAAVTLAATDRPDADLHPWDLAGMYVAVGFALVEVGEWTQVVVLAEAVRALVENAPPEVPLGAQRRIMAAGAHRLAGDLGAAEAELRAAWPHLQPDTCDLGKAELEAARLRRVSGQTAEAAVLHARAAATFRAAGERFLAAATEREAAAS